MHKNLYILTLLTLIWSCGPSETDAKLENTAEATTEETATDSLIYPQEQHFSTLRQLTFGGDNAEAYFSYDSKQLIFQATNPDWGIECDQIFTMPIEGVGTSKPKLLSTGKGRTTCSYFYPGDSTVLYASTHLGDEACPETPRMVNGKYVWAIYEDFDIFKADKNGQILEQLTDNPGYDAEATISPDGQKIVFTSTRSGDLELWVMDIDGSNLQQVTDELGYDGGAFFSPDSKQLIFRASRPKTEEAVKTYKDLLSQGLVQPTNMELYVCNVDGSDLRQITNLGGANWAPYFHPSGKKVLFSTNHHTPSGRVFNIFSINVDGSGLQQITHDDTFDAFPMFSPDGKYLVFSSNRNNGDSRDTNVFLAEWKD
ncbi:MAG: PD40 domain-containing protein [Phaeodactylibacter sp.]|nr:PD40 domain-containing protein [Phaeodactylibacter sp.]